MQVMTWKGKWELLMKINTLGSKTNILWNISTLEALLTTCPSKLHSPTCYQCLWYGLIIIALKQLHFKTIIKALLKHYCFKEMKIYIVNWPDSTNSFSPHRQLSVWIHNGLLNNDNQLWIFWQWQHKFLNFCIPGCLLLHLNIIIQHRY